MKNRIWILFLVLSIACAGAAVWLFIGYQNESSSVDATMDELRSLKASGQVENVDTVTAMPLITEEDVPTVEEDTSEVETIEETVSERSEQVSNANDTETELTMLLPTVAENEEVENDQDYTEPESVEAAVQENSGIEEPSVESVTEVVDEPAETNQPVETSEGSTMESTMEPMETSEESGAEVTAEPEKTPEPTVKVEINENLEMTPLPVATTTPQIEYGMNTVRTSVEPTPTNWVSPEKYVLKEEDILPEYKELYELNHDLIGWLTIDGTKIDYPVVQTETPDYYLKHDFYGRNNINGMLIVTPEYDVLTPSQNILIHGHNMRNGKMFNSLQNYASESFARNHPYVLFDTLTEHRKYEVVSAFYTRIYKEGEEGFRYNLILNGDVEVTKYFVTGIRKNAAYDLGVPFDRYDEYLVLSTCAYQAREGRFVVVAKRIDY